MSVRLKKFMNLLFTCRTVSSSPQIQIILHIHRERANWMYEFFELLARAIIKEIEENEISRKNKVKLFFNCLAESFLDFFGGNQVSGWSAGQLRRSIGWSTDGHNVWHFQCKTKICFGKMLFSRRPGVGLRSKVNPGGLRSVWGRPKNNYWKKLKKERK